MHRTENLSHYIADQIRQGRDVSIIDRLHSDPDRLAPFSNPQELARYREAGTRNMLLEMEPSGAQFIRSMQERNLSAQEIRSEIVSNFHHFSGANQRMPGEDLDRYIGHLTSIVEHTGRLGIRVHSLDNMNEQLVEAGRIAESRAGSNWQNLSQDEQIAARTREFVNLRTSMDNPHATSPTDERIAQYVAQHQREGDNSPWLIQYGAAHFFGTRDLNDRISELTGRQGVTVMAAGDQTPVGQTAAMGANTLAEARDGVIQLPNVVYNPQNGEVRQVRPSAAAEGLIRDNIAVTRWHNGEPTLVPRGEQAIPQNICLQVQNLMSRTCSTPLSPASTAAPSDLGNVTHNAPQSHDPHLVQQR